MRLPCPQGMPLNCNTGAGHRLYGLQNKTVLMALCLVSLSSAFAWSLMAFLWPCPYVWGSLGIGVRRILDKLDNLGDSCASHGIVH